MLPERCVERGGHLGKLAALLKRHTPANHHSDHYTAAHYIHVMMYTAADVVSLDLVDGVVRHVQVLHRYAKELLRQLLVLEHADELRDVHHLPVPQRRLVSGRFSTIWLGRDNRALRSPDRAVH